ncbi:MAG TPA: uroporphyrinogen decarboxylase family protein [Terriglobales bacterium]|nr:uroporphyrinogen decarboxylase family protein [Terriglobales bacterium]
MPENLTPRQIVKQMLQGSLPARPLFLPIVFSLGARLENLPLRGFLGNATKISNSLRQIRGHLRSDGVACYFDSSLELEALGGTLCWDAENQPPTVHWPSATSRGALPSGLRTPEETAKAGRVPVATDVIRRLKSQLQGEPLLMAAVTGPFTLAARLTELEGESALRAEDIPESALALAASVMREVAAALVEAGADAIFIQEAILPGLSAAEADAWASTLAPTFNVIRFYEALPVLLLTDSRSFAESSAVILQRPWDCVVCPALDVDSCISLRGTPQPSGVTLGVALGAGTLDAAGSGKLGPSLDPLLAEWRPILITTAGDVPVTTDMKRLIKVGEEVRR